VMYRAYCIGSYILTLLDILIHRHTQTEIAV
jgi:hypothetical protein